MAQKKVYTESNGRQFTVDHYVYAVEIGSLAPGATLTGSINIEANSNFVWVKSSFVTYVNSGAVNADELAMNIPRINVSINDSGSGLNLQNIPTDLSAIAGQKGLPLVLPQEREFSANSNVQFSFTSYDAALTYSNTKLHLIGYKKFYL